MINTNKSKKGTIKPIHPFKTLSEEAEYWDTHSILDNINDGTVVGFHQANKTNTLTIRFTHDDIQKLREEAFQKGIGPTTLAKMWIKEKLQRNYTSLAR